MDTFCAVENRFVIATLISKSKSESEHLKLSHSLYFLSIGLKMPFVSSSTNSRLNFLHPILDFPFISVCHFLSLGLSPLKYRPISLSYHSQQSFDALMPSHPPIIPSQSLVVFIPCLFFVPFRRFSPINCPVSSRAYRITICNKRKKMCAKSVGGAPRSSAIGKERHNGKKAIFSDLFIHRVGERNLIPKPTQKWGGGGELSLPMAFIGHCHSIHGTQQHMLSLETFVNCQMFSWHCFQMPRGHPPFWPFVSFKSLGHY